MPQQPAGRDFRIDVIRGAALLIILADHVRDSPLASLTPRNFGLSDMAEVFVFLSGCVCGMVYGRVFESGGFRACFTKACVRVAQLAIAGAVTVTLLWILQVSFASQPAPVTPAQPAWKPDGNVNWSLLALVRGIDGAPLVVGILSLYCLLLLALPAMLWLRRRHWSVLMIPSLALYCAAQASWMLSEHSGLWRGTTPFNPLAWQLLFALGILTDPDAVGVRLSAPRGWVWPVTALVVLEAAFLARAFVPPEAMPFIDKAGLGPLRVLHLGALLTLVYAVLPGRCPGSWIAIPLRVMALCGRSSLIVFCAGAVLVVWCERALLPVRADLVNYVLANMAVWGGSALIAALWQRVRRTTPASGACEPAEGTWATTQRPVV